MLENRKSLELGSAALRKKLLQQKILVKQADQLLFNQGCLFKSVMQAAEAVCGYSVNGKQVWRDLTGKPRADYVNQIPPTSAAHLTRLSTAPSQA